MLKVHFTVDVEIWCGGWHDIDAKFPAAYRRYIHGPEGGGLPFQLELLRDHGLVATCFVEPLFATRFGVDPLSEIVGLVRERGHDVQLHLHTEWVDEAREPLLPTCTGKRQHLRHFSLEEQRILIAAGADLLQRAGAERPVAFRAGSFAFDRNTLLALADNDIHVDSSYNASLFGPSSGVCPDELLHQPRMIGPVLELPMTVFSDGRSLRHAQLTACSYRELERVLWHGVESGSDAVVLLSHSFELLTPSMRRVDPTVVRRLRRLCRLLEDHPDVFDVTPMRKAPQPPPERAVSFCRSPLWCTGLRMAEQAWRRRFA